MSDDARAEHFRTDLLRWIDAHSSVHSLALVEDYLEDPGAAYGPHGATVDDLVNACVDLWRAGLIDGQYVQPSEGLSHAHVTPAGRLALDASKSG